jgi:RimJ/RimL family protein N-acetyltransferase
VQNLAIICQFRTAAKDLGVKMMQLFMKTMFNDPLWPIHKLYATTASGNSPSVKLLKISGFHLDGCIREHYWIRGVMEDQLHFSLLHREYLAMQATSAAQPTSELR